MAYLIGQRIRITFRHHREHEILPQHFNVLIYTRNFSVCVGLDPSRQRVNAFDRLGRVPENGA